MALRRMETVLAIEVYAGERGYVCIKQEDPLGDTQDVVAMLPEQIPTIIRWLQECCAEVASHDITALTISDATSPSPRLRGAVDRGPQGIVHSLAVRPEKLGQGD
jgi:hypothetical protein